MFTAHLVASAVLVTVLATLSGLQADVVFLSIEVLAVVAASVGARLRPRGARLPWGLLAIALALMLVGDAIHMVVPDHLLHPAMLTFADAVFLVAYGSLGVAGYLLVRLHSASHGVDGMIDGTIVSIAVGVVLFHVLQAQSVGSSSTVLGRLVLFATPLLVLVGLVASLRAAVMAGRLVRGPWMLVGAAVLSVTGSVVLATTGQPLFGHDLVVVDVCWALAFALGGAAAIPSRDELRPPPPRVHTAHVSYARLGVLAAALVAAPVAMLMWPTDSAVGPVVPAVASLLITVLVVLRLARLVVERERTQHELHAHAEQQAGLARLGDLALGDAEMDEVSAAAIDLVTDVTDARDCTVVDEPAHTVAGEDAALRIPLHGTATMALVVDLPAPTETDRLFLAAVANTLGSAARQRATEAALLHQTRHDPLTGLPNRLVLADRLGHALARRSAEPVSLLLLDLDGFKNVNDQLGHAAGDRLLQQVATRLGDCLRAGDTLVRLGGDEFTVIVEDLDDDGSIDLANRLTAALAAPFDLPEPATVGASIGLARARPDDDPDTLLRRADAAMYRAKATNATRSRRRPTAAR